MMSQSRPYDVECSGEGLNFGYLRRPILANIDTRRAGPGELTVYCDGAKSKAFCELRDHRDGLFTLTVRAQDSGMHDLYIKYDGENVPGSPFGLRVSSASLIKVSGPGIRHGLLSQKYCSEIHIDTEEAGPGDVGLKVGGPKGAFKVELRREGKILKCRYNPRETGLYTIQISWSGDPVPGTPYQVFMTWNERELQDYIARQSAA